MSRKVIVSQEAKLDILEIWNYRAEAEGITDADLLVKKLEKIIKSISKHPERGHIPPELERVDEYNYREVHFLPFRILYKITSEKIIIHCVLDGRRDMQSLLYDRLIR